MVKTFPRIPVMLPRKEIFLRMGHNRHLTVMSTEHEARIDRLMQQAFSLCEPAGCFELFDGVEITDSEVRAHSGVCFASASLAKMLFGCCSLVLLGVTVGAKASELAAQCIAEGRGADALVYDATASEVADATMDWLCSYLARDLPRQGRTLTRTRFSPGYGDLGLDAQQSIFQHLSLESLGISLTPSWMMIPEKSVTAIAGVLPGQG